MKDLPPPLRRPMLRNCLAAGIAVVFILCMPLFAPNFKTDRDPGRDGPLPGDFAQEYLGAYIIVHGDHLLFYDLQYASSLQHDPGIMGMVISEKDFLPMIYPPFYYFLIAPLAWLPFLMAAVVWLIIMAGSLGLTVWLLARAYPEHPALWTWGLAGAFFFVPLLEDLASGQKATLALLILTATFLLLDRGRPLLAGLVFGLLAFKPQLTLVVGFAMLIKLQGRFLFGGTITGAFLVGLSLFVGLDVCGQYLQLSQNMAEYIDRAGFKMEKMHCWYGFWKLLLSGQPLAVVQIATGVCSLATIAVLARLLWGPIAYGRPAFARQFAGMIIATVLLSPHLLTYDLTILLLPLFLLLHLLLTHADALQGRQGQVIWGLVLLYVAAGVSPALARLTHVQVTVLILFALLATIAVPKDGWRRLRCAPCPDVVGIPLDSRV